MKLTSKLRSHSGTYLNPLPPGTPDGYARIPLEDHGYDLHYLHCSHHGCAGGSKCYYVDVRQHSRTRHGCAPQFDLYYVGDPQNYQPWVPLSYYKP